MKKIFSLLFLINQFAYAQDMIQFNEYNKIELKKGIEVNKIYTEQSNFLNYPEPAHYGSTGLGWGNLFSSFQYIDYDDTIYIFDLDGFLKWFDKNLIFRGKIDLRYLHIETERASGCKLYITNKYIIISGYGKSHDNLGPFLYVLDRSGNLLFDNNNDNAITNSIMINNNKIFGYFDSQDRKKLAYIDCEDNFNIKYYDDPYKEYFMKNHDFISRPQFNEMVKKLILDNNGALPSMSWWERNVYYYYRLDFLRNYYKKPDLLKISTTYFDDTNQNRFAVYADKNDIHDNYYIFYDYKIGDTNVFTICFVYNKYGQLFKAFRIEGILPSPTCGGFVRITKNGDIYYNFGKNIFEDYSIYKITNTWDPISEKEYQNFLKNEGFSSSLVSQSMTTTFSSLTSSGQPIENYDKNVYHPAKLFDDDPLTSWIEDKPGFGDGAWVGASFNNAFKIDEIRISGGYFDPQWWQANNRVKKAIINLNGKDYTMDFTDKMTMQALKLPAEVFLKDFKLTIKDAYLATGQAWNDTAISEIEFYYQGKKVQVDLGTYGEFLKVVPVK